MGAIKKTRSSLRLQRRRNQGKENNMYFFELSQIVVMILVLVILSYVD